MASRAVCPRCRRSYEATAIVCNVDGEPLIEEDLLFLGDKTEPQLTPPSLISASRRPDQTPDATPALPPPPAPRAATPPLRTTQPPIASRAALPPSGPRPDLADPLFRTTGPNAPARRRTDPPIARRRTTDPLMQRQTPVPGSLPSGYSRDSGPVPRVDANSTGWLGERLGPYRLLRQLGEGGMARIYLAEHEKLGRICAIKRLHADHFADRLTVARFLAEARAVGAIHHPNLVAAYDVVEEPTEIYLVMEYLDGRDVAQVLRTEGPMTPARAADIIAQACDGLAAVHAHNIIHRDLKPENIFLTRDPDGHERVKLLDFGVARLIGDRPQELKTRSGLTVGTPTYMSPEQATASEIDARSDIYTVGVVLYEMLSGMPPFTGAGYGDVMLMHVNDAAPRLSSRRSDVPPWLENVVSRCLEKEPGQRYESAAELAAVLRAGPRSSTPLVTDPRGTMRVRTIPQVRQRPRWKLMAAAGAAVVLLAGAATAAVLWSRHADPIEPAIAPVVTAPVLPAPTVTPLPSRAPEPPPIAPVVQPTPPPPVAVILPPHRVRVQTVPLHAFVAVGDEPPCRAPCDLSIPNVPGTVEIRVSAKGYIGDKRTVDSADPPSPLKLRLVKAPRPKRKGAGARLWRKRPVGRPAAPAPSDEGRNQTVDPFSK